MFTPAFAFLMLERSFFFKSVTTPPDTSFSHLTLFLKDFGVQLAKLIMTDF